MLNNLVSNHTTVYTPTNVEIESQKIFTIIIYFPHAILLATVQVYYLFCPHIGIIIIISQVR